MNVNLVPVGQIDQVWPMVLPGVEASINRCDSDLTAAFLWQLCRAGNGFLIVAADETGIRALTIHRFEYYRSGPKLSCLATWGPNMHEWFEDMKAVAARVGAAGGANSFVSEGSDAYLRMLPGAKKIRTLFEVPF